MKMDLKGWKKLGSDAKSTTMQHRDGHRITIAHGPLSPKLREHLASIPAMAEGGSVQASPSPGQDDVPDPDKKKAQEFQKGATTSGFGYLKEGFDNAKKELGFADGGQVDSPEAIARDAAAQAAPQQAPVTINIQGGGAQQPEAPHLSGAQQFGQGLGQRIAQSPPVMAGKALVGAAQQVIPAVSGGIQGLASGLSGQPIAQPQPEAPQPQGQMPPPANPGATGQRAPAQAAPTDDYQGQMAGGYKQQIAGIDAAAKAAGELGNEEADIKGQQARNDAYMVRNQEEAKEKGEVAYQQFVKSVQDGEIDPQRFWKSPDAPSKLRAAIGMILGAGGAAVAGQSNAAEDYINTQINRDIDAQKANLASRNNLLAHNMEHFRNMQDAEAVTRTQYNAMYAHMLDQAASKNKSPAAKAAAMEAKGKLQQANAMILSGMGKSPSGSGDGGGSDVDSQAQNYLQTMRMINPERAKEFESRYVPGVGVAQIPVPADVRGKITGKQTLDARARDLYSWAAEHSGSLDPATIAQGKTKAAELQSMYRQAIDGGVFKKGEQDFIDNIVDSDPAKFFNSIRVLPKLKEVINSNGSQLDLLKKSYLIQGGGHPQSSSGSGNISFTPVKR